MRKIEHVQMNDGRRDAWLQTVESTRIEITTVDLRGLDRFACWINGWLPFGIVLGRKNGRRRFFRPWH